MSSTSSYRQCRDLGLLKIVIKNQTMIKVGSLLFCFFLLAAAEPSCRFANEFTRDQLLFSEEARQQYLENVMYWEGKFAQDGIGLNFASGYTYDGHPIDYTSGEITGEPHLFSAPSKESLHVSILAHILNGSSLAQLTISNDSKIARQTAITIAENKIRTYEKFNAQFPGYGGFHPWVTVNDSGIFPVNGWTDKVPSLDNGELIWALVALAEVLSSQGLTDLAKRYQDQVDLMAKYGAMIFYEGNGNVRTVALIGNTSATPFPENYKTPSDCGNPCYLDDPYEGELFVDFLCLYGGIPQADQDKMWQNKIAKIQAVDYQTPLGNITVQRGWWSSAHENWKFLMLPYQDVDIVRRVYKNGEKAKTWDSYLNKIPGMFASVNDVCPPNGTIQDYISATGIQEIAFEPVLRRDVITGYGTYNIFLVEPITALIWFDNYLKAPKGQNPYGATEGIAVNGSMISPLTTWDTKMTTVCAMLGGVSEFTRKALIKDGLYQNFISRIQNAWGQVFKTLKGEKLPFMLPSSKVPQNMEDFTSCSSSFSRQPNKKLITN